MAKITIVDDDKQLLNILSLTLKRGGHTVTTIDRPQEVLARLRADKPDLLLLDVMMPRVSGHEICRQVKADPLLADVPVIILTARAQTADREAALAIGADDYLAKPVKSKELLDCVESVLSAEPSEAVTHGVLVGVLGFRGGVGCTTVAVNLAMALRTLSEQPVALVDLSPAGSQAAIHLRLRTAHSWADLPAAGDLDGDSVDGILESHATGLQLLAAPDMPVAAHLPDAAQTTAVLGHLRETHRFTVVDLPKALNPAARATLGLADLVLHVFTPELVAVRHAAHAQQALNVPAYRSAQQAFVLNNVMPEAQLPRAAVERALQAKVAFEFGFDPHQQGAMAEGELVTGTSPLPAGARKLAGALWQRARATVIV